MHCVTEEGIRWQTKEDADTVAGDIKEVNSITTQVFTRDAAVVGFGKPWSFPTPLAESPDLDKYGASFCLTDNLWGTNYVMWYPFEEDSNDENIIYAFTIRSFKSW